MEAGARGDCPSPKASEVSVGNLPTKFLEAHGHYGNVMEYTVVQILYIKNFHVFPI